MSNIILPDFFGLFRNLDKQVYLVGGAVRDLLLGKKVNDFDFVCKCKIEDFFKVGESFFKEFFHVKPFLIGRDFPPTLRAVIKKKRLTIDFTLLINDFKLDALRRDFKINAIFFDLKEKKVIDPLNGLKDIEDRKINVCSNNSFKDDPVRLLRAIRFLGSLENFKLTKNTYILIKRDSELIVSSAKERIREEFDKIIEMENFFLLLKYLDKTNILMKIFPCYFTKYFNMIKKLKIIPYNERGLYIYSLFLTSTPIEQSLLKFSNKEKKIIKFLLKGVSLINSFNDDIEIKKFILKNYYYIEYLIKFCEIIGLKKNLYYIKKNYEIFNLKKEIILSIINGNDIKELGINEGRIIGKILEEVRLLTFMGKIKNKDEAIEYIKNYAKK